MTTLLRFSALLRTSIGVLRLADSTSTIDPPTELPSSLLKLLALYALELSTEPRSLDFSFLSDPMAPLAAARILPRLGLLERLVLRTRTSSVSDGEIEKVNSLSLPGVPLPDPGCLDSLRRSRPARTRS